MSGVALPLLDAMLRCAGCHDQCLFATAEAAASGDQARVVSRVAALGLQLNDGRLPWTVETAEALFYGLNDGAQAEYCIYGSEGHRVEPYMRALRAEAVERGLAPAFVAAAAAARTASGNVFGVELPSNAGPWSGVVLLHDAAIAVLAPEAPRAARRLLDRAGLAGPDVWVQSSGAVEEELGLVDAAEGAGASAISAVESVDADLVVSADPVLVAHLRRLLAGRDHTPRVVHLVEALTATSIAFRIRAGSVAIHDDGASGRALDLSSLVRALVGRIPGLVVREPVNAGRWATSDGPLAGYPSSGLAAAIARRRYAELERAGADLIVTVSPYSLANLRGVAGGTPVEDLAVFLDAVGEPG